jgi:hypothetical protein
MYTLFALAVTLAVSPGTPVSDIPADTPSLIDRPFVSGLIASGIKTTSDSYTDGFFSMTIPVFSSIGRDGNLGGSVLLLEPYISWGEQGEVATSLGLGFRHMFNQQPVTALQHPSTGWREEGLMLGGNLFLDMLDTQTNNRFWQFGVGAEMATRYLELRANYYHPLTGRQEGAPILQREIERGTFLTSGKEPFATGHTIQQDVTFTTYDFYTDALFRTYEEGMKGWDAEAALLVPGLDKWCELWLIGGYGSFDNQPFGPQISGTGKIAGWKAGIEFRPIPQVILSTTRFENERLAGGELVYGLSLQIPLDPEPANPNKSWWSKIKDSLHPRSRHLAERTAVPVRRQNAAVKVANTIGEPEITQYSKVVAKEERRVVVRDDVIFVNNGVPQGNGIAGPGTIQNGTAEQPYDTVREGVTLAAKTGFQSRGVPTIYVAGGGPDYNGEQWFSIGISDLILRSGVRLVSGGYGIPAFGGRYFGIGTPARIQPSADSTLAIGGLYGVNFSQYISVEGFNFLGHVIVAAERVSVRRNTMMDGLSVESFNAEILSNSVFGNFTMSDGLFFVTRRPNGHTSATVSGNRLMGNATASFFAVDRFDYVTFTDNDVYWRIPSSGGGAPGEPLAAFNFWSCSNVSLGNNRIKVEGFRTDLSGVAIFGFIGPTEIHHLGGNQAIRGSNAAQKVFGVSQLAAPPGESPTSLSGSLFINDVPIPLSSSNTLLGRLW